MRNIKLRLIEEALIFIKAFFDTFINKDNILIVINSFSVSSEYRSRKL